MDSLTKIIQHIPADDYETWIKVGMALKHEGFSVSDWDEWSSSSSKYKPGACQRKWETFNEATQEIVTAGTIVQMAKDNGWRPVFSSESFGWDDEVEEIGRDYRLIDKGFVKEQPIPRMKGEPLDDLRDYLSLLFNEDDYVGYCDKLTFEDGKYIPKNGIRSRTAGELLKKLKGGYSKASIASESEGGAMIRFNPLDGMGEADGNVTEFRYCLVESDKDSIEKQYALLKEMQLPIRVLVHSGNKSLHAIIRVNARTPREYRERVNFIYDFCKKNGLHVDENDKNASRYSRMPGIKRGNMYQYIVGTDLGFKTFDEWRTWVDEQNDNLPEDINLGEAFKELPSLAPELISGMLRVGHKMLISGPSKAGKSFMLMKLAICIAEGLEWLGHKCRPGKVLYVNLELDQASCLHRLHDIYSMDKIEPKHASDITVWNLRGRSVPMDKLTPFLIRRFKGKGYAAVILDPIYKVITGDENSATDMSLFCSYFDRAAIEVNAAMIYCHHHSKGAGMKYSRAADRASGSGVFARDPDAIVDLLELEATQDMIDRFNEQNQDASKTLSAWEMSCTLREFPPLDAIRLWFDYPSHVLDEWNFLAEAKEGETSRRGVGIGKKQRNQIEWDTELKTAYEMNGGDTNIVELRTIVSYLQTNGKPSERTIIDNLRKRNYEVREFGGKKVVTKKA